MRLQRSNSILVALFFGGIILPTAILAFLSFRSIQNELFLAEKNFEENLTSFQKEMAEAVKREQHSVLQETKTASQFLYEQPQNFLEFGNATSFKNVDGVSAIFLFNGPKLIYPSIPIHVSQDNVPFPEANASLIESEIFKQERLQNQPGKIYLARSIRLMQAPFETHDEKVQNLLGLLRIHYNNKNYSEALKIIDALEKHPNIQGYLHVRLKESLNLMRFEILVELKKHQAAQDYCLAVLSHFLESHHVEDIGATRFFFESAFNRILSFEDLDRDTREAFWNLRENLNRQLTHIEIFSQHQVFFNRFISDYTSPKEGVLYQQDDQQVFFRMSHPWLSGDQVVIGMIQKEKYRTRLLTKIAAVAREWKDIPYTMTDANDSVLMGNLPDSNATLANQRAMGDGLGWTLTVYQRDTQELRKETRHKMLLLYSLVGFSLLTVILGSFFVFRSLTQEQRLLFMKSNFLSSVSHELKTPLTSIKMFAEMMAKGRVQKIEKMQEYSGLIGKESTRLENLIGAILNYTRLENGTQSFHWERLDMTVCTEKVYSSLLEIANNRGVTMECNWENGNFVMGDYTALYSLVQNLIENAIKYTNPPGHIFVQVFSENDKVVFSVTDTGVGIALSEQKNIFNDFYRVGDEMTRSTKGSGLGLAIVKRVADTHKASISVQSRPGKGSTFTVRLKKAE
jgi:signal transduction histidine kinase